MLSRKRRSFALRASAGAAALVLSLGPANAADQIPLKAKLKAEPFSWTGAYVGGMVGYSVGRVNSTIVDPATSSGSERFSGVYGGVQAGYNHLLNSRVLLGIEADISFTNHLLPNQVIATRTTAATTVTETLDYLATFRGRIGYAFDLWMIYGTGGLAVSQGRFVEAPGVVEDEDKKLRTRIGWAAGAGAEMPVAKYWTARIEYLYANLGSVTAAFPSGNQYQSTFDIHTVRVGLNRQLKTGEDGTFFGPKLSDDSGLGGDWNVHGQFTVIGQGYRAFRSPYEGANSLSGANQMRNTGTLTAFLGIRPWQNGEIYFNPEIMQGFGLSDVHGVAAFPNGEAQKSSFPVPRFNMARMFYRHTFGLGGEQEKIEDGPNQLAGKQDISRVSFTVGKFAVPDYFNLNAYSGEPRTGFMNWQMYGGGSYDWTMDRLSWSWGAMVDFNQKHWAFRAGYFLLPRVSNVDNFDMNIGRGQYVAELELRYAVFSQPGKFRFFAWLNHGSMGSYADALGLPVTSPDYPDITLTRKVRNNYGFVANFEQAINDDFGVFSRLTWSPGQIELIGWTDTHHTASLGGVLKGTAWGRPSDKVGLSGIVEGLSDEGRAYFAAGGMGILIGDGRLNYKMERALETYYAYAINKWSTFTFDYQLVVNPGYNADRGPVSFYSLRYHAEW